MRLPRRSILGSACVGALMRKVEPRGPDVAISADCTEADTGIGDDIKVPAEGLAGSAAATEVDGLRRHYLSTERCEGCVPVRSSRSSAEVLRRLWCGAVTAVCQVSMPPSREQETASARLGLAKPARSA